MLSAVVNFKTLNKEMPMHNAARRMLLPFLFMAITTTPRVCLADSLDAIANRVSSHAEVLRQIKDGSAIRNAWVTGVTIQPTYAVRNLKLVGSKTSFPESIRTETFVARNCTKQDRAISQTFGLSVDVGVEVSVTTAADIRDDVKASFGAAADLPFTANLEAARSVSFSITRGVSERKTTTERKEWTENREIPATTLLTIRAERTLFKDNYPFQAEVVVGGTATVYREALVAISSRIGGENLVRMKLSEIKFDLTQLFPNEHDRLANASGYLSNSFSDDLKISYGEAKLDPTDRKVCPDNAAKIADKAQPIFAKLQGVELTTITH